ncbi:MAG: HD domain-containing protein, partial [Thermoplasmata archaeon]
MPERAPRNEARKSIYDPVHGPIVLEGSALELIGTAEFQRLWGIRQTGLAHLVFPGANHTRLEHSLGVFWVARRISEGLGLPARDRRLVEAGALLHDLGHPPFSHTLEPTMREVLGHGHERRSRQLIVGSVRSDGDVAQILRRAGVDPDAVADLVDPVRTERSP